MKAKWIVESKYTTKKEAKKYYASIGEDSEDYDIPNFGDVEISVIRKYNKRGIESYGWNGLNKIILFGDNDYTKKEMKWCEQVAKTICDALNKEKL